MEIEIPIEKEMEIEIQIEMEIEEKWDFRLCFFFLLFVLFPVSTGKKNNIYYISSPDERDEVNF